MIKTLDDAVSKCKETKSMVVGKVRLVNGGEVVLLVMPVIKQTGTSEEIGTIEVSIKPDAAMDLAEKLKMAVDADTTGWVMEE